MKNSKYKWLLKSINRDINEKQKRKWYLEILAWAWINLGLFISLFFFACSSVLAIVYAILLYSNANIDPEVLEKVSKGWEITLPITALIFGAFLALWVIGESYRNIIKDFQARVKNNNIFLDKSDKLLVKIEKVYKEERYYDAPVIWKDITDSFNEWQVFSLGKNKDDKSFLDNYWNNALLTDSWVIFIDEKTKEISDYFGEQKAQEILNQGTILTWTTLFKDEQGSNEISYLMDQIKKIEKKVTGKNDNTELLNSFFIPLLVQSKDVAFIYNDVYDNILSFRRQSLIDNDKINEIIGYCMNHKHKKKFCSSGLYAIKHIDEIELWKNTH